MIPLKYAYLCADRACDTVADIREHKRCPSCSFALHVPLSRFLNRPTRDDLAVAQLRQTWRRGERM